jgi:hypothetical protein
MITHRGGKGEGKKWEKKERRATYFPFFFFL